MSPFVQVFHFVEFSSSFLLHSLLRHPLLLLLLLILALATLLSWRLLASLPPPPALSCPCSCLLLLLLLLALTYQKYRLQASLGETQGGLQEAHWALRQGQEHRSQLLERMARRFPQQREPEDESLDGGNNPLDGGNNPLDGANKLLDDGNKLLDGGNNPLDGANNPLDGGENPLDGCLHVFLDLGSNRGLQIRKLYEPHLFPLAPVLDLYSRYFGRPEDRNLQEVCSVGFEPNPSHTSHLQSLAANYSTCGIKVVMFTETGVSDRDTVGTFATQISVNGVDVIHDMAARFISEDQSLKSLKETHFLGDSGSMVSQIRLMRVSKFITDVVAKRKLPLSAEVHSPRVVVKCDIEGAELQVVPDMLLTGALGLVDNLHMEWHGVEGPGFTREGQEAQMISTLEEAVNSLGGLTERLGMEQQFVVEELDDETYSGLSVYGMFGDYTHLPTPTC